MEPLTVQIQVENEDCLPAYATPNASGMDLKAFEDCCLAPGERRAVRTGIRIALPEGYEAQVRPRSGLALQKGLSIPNAPGTIDSDYRGEVKVILINLGSEPVAIKKGERIAQLVICPVAKAQWEVVAHLPQTERGDGGFGSTGTL
jgi:dUTP pyrophosphatase